MTKRFAFLWSTKEARTTHLTPAPDPEKEWPPRAWSNPLSPLVPKPTDWRDAMKTEEMCVPGFFADMPLAEVNRRFEASQSQPHNYMKPKVRMHAGKWFVSGLIDGRHFSGEGPTARTAWRLAQRSYFRELGRFRNAMELYGRKV